MDYEIENLKQEIRELKEEIQKINKKFDNFKIEYSFSRDSDVGAITNLLKWNDLFQRQIKELREKMISDSSDGGSN